MDSIRLDSEKKSSIVWNNILEAISLMGAGNERKLPECVSAGRW